MLERNSEKCCEDGNSVGKKESAGKSAGSSAVACVAKDNCTASSTPSGTPLVPGNVLAALFRGTPLQHPISVANGFLS